MSQLPPKQKWEVDFPIDRVESQHVTRREFAKFLCVVSGGLCVGNAWLAVKDKLFPKAELTGEYKICAVSEIAVGGMRSFEIAETGLPYILIRLGENEWRVFEQKCTHLSCAVFYSAEQSKIVCPCHNGFFDPRNGEVLQGPPPRALPQLPVEVRDEHVFVLPPRREEAS